MAPVTGLCISRASPATAPPAGRYRLVSPVAAGKGRKHQKEESA